MAEETLTRWKHSHSQPGLQVPCDLYCSPHTGQGWASVDPPARSLGPTPTTTVVPIWLFIERQMHTAHSTEQLWVCILRRHCCWVDEQRELLTLLPQVTRPVRLQLRQPGGLSEPWAVSLPPQHCVQWPHSRGSLEELQEAVQGEVRSCRLGIPGVLHAGHLSPGTGATASWCLLSIAGAVDTSLPLAAQGTAPRGWSLLLRQGEGGLCQQGRGREGQERGAGM